MWSTRIYVSSLFSDMAERKILFNKYGIICFSIWNPSVFNIKMNDKMLYEYVGSYVQNE